MHDIRLIRENPDAFDAALSRRNIGPTAAIILDIDPQTQIFETNPIRLLRAASRAVRFRSSATTFPAKTNT